MAASGRLATEGITPMLVSADERCFRATGTDTDATDLAPLSRSGARYDHPGGPQSLYASRRQHVAHAELERRAGVGVARFRITTIQVKALLLDAYTREGLLRLGLRRGDLVQADKIVCRELAEMARASSASGLLVPSAAVDDELNVVIWREAVPEVVRVLNWRIASTSDLSKEPTDSGG
jgi:RES domain-containing protein